MYIYTRTYVYKQSLVCVLFGYFRWELKYASIELIGLHKKIRNLIWELMVNDTTMQ